MDWIRILRAISPRAKQAVLDEIAPHIEAEFAKCDVTTPLRQAHFLAQAAHETDGFCTLTEYGPPAYFAKYEPGTLIGRRLGNKLKGDGARFRGRGVFQTTGRENYTKDGRAIGVDLVKAPELAATGGPAVALAGVYWSRRGLNALADRDDVRGITVKINGGLNGFSERKTYLARAKRAIAAHAEPEDEGQPAVLLAADAPPPPLPADKIRAIQQRLDNLGYHMVGRVDGSMGGSTVAALSAFQHDNELPITGLLDPATEDALWAAGPRPIPADRAEGVPEDSRIVAGAETLKRGAAAIGGTGLLMTGNDAIAKVEAARGYYERLQSALAPFGAVKAWALDHAGLLLLAAAVVVGIMASRIMHARIEDYRKGRAA